MKRIVCIMLSLVIMLTACLALSPVTVSAKSGRMFKWIISDEDNYPANTFPEITRVILNSGGIEIGFWKPRNYTNYGYRIYIDSPNQSDWRAVEDVYGGSIWRNSDGSYWTHVNLYNSDLYYIFDKSNVNNIRWEGEWDSRVQRYYYPFRVTIRALDAYGNAVGNYRKNAWLTPTGEYSTWSGDNGLMAPVLIPGGENSFETAFNSGRSYTYGSTTHGWHVSNICLGSGARNGDCVNFIRIYYKNKSGGWTRLTDVYPDKNHAYTFFTFNLSRVLSNSYYGNSCYELTARTFDYDGDWISGYLSGAKAFRSGGGWTMHMNQIR